MAQYLGMVQLGGFYKSGTALKRPTKPWRTDTEPGSGMGVGDIPSMSGSMANYTIGDTPSDAAKRLQWHKIKDGDKTLLICDRVILVMVSWSGLNAQGYITGKTVTIDGATYTCRVPTGGEKARTKSGSSDTGGGNGTGTYGGYPADNEWDRFVSNEDSVTGLPVPVSSDLDSRVEADEETSAHNQAWHWFGIYSLCQEGHTNSYGQTIKAGRGNSGTSYWYPGRKDDQLGWIGFRPVLEVVNTAPTTPTGITVPAQINGGSTITLSWGASTDAEANLEGYKVERSVDGGEWEAVFTGDALSYADQITKGWQTVAYRVRAYDTASAYSGFVTSETRQVNNNTPPAITCATASGTNLGIKSEGFAVPYSVADEEGDAVTVTEAVDGTILRTFTATLGGDNSLQLTGEDFMRLLNGPHTLAVTAADGASSATHSLSFSKLVTAASITLAQPMEADGPITVCVLSVSGSIPADADLSVEVTNNANDAAPAWEDCTAEVKAGANYVFANNTTANGFAFNFRITAERGTSGEGGYITSVQGGFQ